MAKEKIQERLERWHKDLTKAIQKGTRRGRFALEDTHLLQCPWTVILASSNERPEIHPFPVWGKETVGSIRGNRYLNIEVVTSNTNSHTAPLAMVRSHRWNNAGQKTQGGCLTILHDPPGKRRVVPPKGLQLRDGTQYVYAATESLATTHMWRSTTGEQNRLSRLGKRSLVAAHTCDQFGSAGLLRQDAIRFFVCLQPEDGLIRAAHTIQKYCGGDPRRTTKNGQWLTNRWMGHLVNWARTLETQLIMALKGCEPELARQRATSLACASPILRFGAAFEMRLCPDLAYGLSHQTSALGLHLFGDKNNCRNLWESIEE